MRLSHCLGMGHHEVKVRIRGRKHLCFKEHQKPRGIDTPPESTAWAPLPPSVIAARTLAPLSQPRQMSPDVALFRMVATSPDGYYTLDMWLVQIEMYCKCEIHTALQRLSTKRGCKVFQ